MVGSAIEGGHRRYRAGVIMPGSDNNSSRIWRAVVGSRRGQAPRLSCRAGSVNTNSRIWRAMVGGAIEGRHRG